MNNAGIEFHKDRARKIIFEKIFPAYERQEYLYRYIHQGKGSAIQSYVYPREIKKGSYEHCLWLFFTNLMTYRSSSLVGFRQCVWLWEHYPQIFSETIFRISEEILAGMLRRSGNVHPNENAKRWKGSGETLFAKYKGDPLLIFQRIGNIDDLMKEKMHNGRNALPGLGPKLASLLALFYEELDLMPHLKGAFPVDVHIMAQCIGSGVLSFSNGYVNATAVAETIRKGITSQCYEFMVPALELSHAMWFLGNELCINCRRKRILSEQLCPIFDCCNGGPSTEIYRAKGKWSKEREEKFFPLLAAYN